MRLHCLSAPNLSFSRNPHDHIAVALPRCTYELELVENVTRQGTLRDLLDRFSYDCLWRTQLRTKRGRTDCGVYLPDLEHKRPPDLPPGMAKLRLVKMPDR